MFYCSRGTGRRVPRCNRRFVLYARNLFWRGGEVTVNETEEIFEPVERIIVGSIVRKVLPKGVPKGFEDVIVQGRELALATREELPRVVFVEHAKGREWL